MSWEPWNGTMGKSSGGRRGTKRAVLRRRGDEGGMKDRKGLLGKFIKQGAALLLAVVVVAFYGLYKSSDRLLQAGGFSDDSLDAESGEMTGLGGEEDLSVELVLAGRQKAEDGFEQDDVEAEDGDADEAPYSEDEEDAETSDAEDVDKDADEDADRTDRGGSGDRRKHDAELSGEAEAGSGDGEAVQDGQKSGDESEHPGGLSSGESGETAVISEQTEEIVGVDSAEGRANPIAMVSEEDGTAFVEADPYDTGTVAEGSVSADGSSDKEWTEGDLVAVGEEDLSWMEGLDPDEEPLVTADAEEPADSHDEEAGMEAADAEEVENMALAGNEREDRTIFFLEGEEPAPVGDEEISAAEDMVEGTGEAGGSGGDGFSDEPVVLRTAAEDGAVITVTAPAGVLPEGAHVRAGVASRADVQEAVREAAEEGRVVVRAQAYSVVILDAEGNKIDPDGKITVSIQSPSVLEGTTNTVYHITPKGAVKQ